jgi:glycosyltransferase involved in cell wall biosynthesis
MNLIRLAVVVPRVNAADPWGAERHYEGLWRALNSDGVSAEMIQVTVDESSFETILEAYLKCYELDLSRFDGVISTKAPTYMVRHPNHICWLLHTIRVFYDMYEREFPHPSAALEEQRRFIIGADAAALCVPHLKRLFVNGEEGRQRLLEYTGLDAEVLHPPLPRECFAFQRGDRGYAFTAARLHRWKRIELTIRAMQFTRTPIELWISGRGEDESALKSLAEGNPRIRFLGRVSDEALADLYGGARVVPFTPLREDFGYITVEAFRSGKPVITCEDSGEPARLVRHGVSGFVVKPAPEEIARCLDYFFEHPDQARDMGRNGAESIRHLNWDAVRSRILSALGFQRGEKG